MKNAEPAQSNPGIGVMLALLTCSMLILMGGAAVAPGLPNIESHFSNDKDLVSFIITLPHLAVAIVGFLMGLVSDRIGKVRTLVISLIVFITTGCGSYFLDNIYAILVLRFLLGFGLAGIVCAVTALIGSYYTGHQRTKMLGLQSASMGVGILILEVTGGALSDISWNAPFLVYLIAVPFLILVLLFLRKPTAEHEQQMVSDGTKTDMRMLATMYLAIFVGMIVLFVIPTKAPTYMEGVMGISAATMGLYLGFHGLGNSAFSLMHRRFSQVMNPMQMIILAFLLLGIALVIPEALGDEVYAGVLMLVVSGSAVGFLVPSIVSCVVNASNPSNRGKMMGIYAVCLNMGQFTISLISIPALSYADDSYPDMFVLFAIAALAMAAMLALAYYVGKVGRSS